DLLVVEIAELRGRESGAAIYASLAQSPGQPALADRLPPDLRPQLAAMLERGGLEPDRFSAEETWAAAITLARIDATGDPAHGVDRALIEEFSGRRPVRELEGLRGQLSIFDRLPEVQQRVMLAAVVRESDKARRDPERLLRAWLAGDAVTIAASTREGFLADPALREALLVGRNRRWTAALATLLRGAPRPLVAVGTAHLVGPDGLVAMLEAQGYRVRPIPTAARPAP
ncbi:MAG: TraB/GumN family protein, partial [Porphyrobacter sp.]|nr:TraB/GumN family protein [Porphyrobacter sp.]